MTTSTPPAWKWLHECYVPVATPEESSVIAPDPTGEDIWPLERAASATASSAVCADQCTDCRCAPNMPHSPDCDCTAQLSSVHVDCPDGVSVVRDDNPCEETAQLTDAHSNVVPEHPDCAVSQTGNAPDTGNTVPRDFGVSTENEDFYTTAPETTAPADSNPAKMADRTADNTEDNPLLNHMECTFNSCMDTAVAKNEGYAGSADPMANFKESVKLGVPVPTAVAIRLSDKWARLCRLLRTGENPLADESITDTIMDAINYLAILLYALDGEVR